MTRKAKTAAALAIAALAFELPAGAAPTDFRLLPAGEFRSCDGRPAECAAWVLDDDNAAILVAAAASRESDYVIDYEHQTLLSAQNGQAAPAAAWFKALEWRPGDGIYIIGADWTALAAQRVIDKQYRYVSPVFSYDKATGRVQKLFHAALTNNPGLDGLTDLAALAALIPDPLTQEPAMDDLLEQLRWLLNLPVGATAEDILAQLGKLSDQIKAAAPTDAAAAMSFRLAEFIAAQDTAIATLKAAAPDAEKFVAVAALTAVQTELATLKGERQTEKIAALVGDALAAGKLVPAQKAWALALGETDLAALSAFLDTAQVVFKPGTTQTGGASPGGDADLNDASALAARAVEFQQAELKAGRSINSAQAVAHVKALG